MDGVDPTSMQASSSLAHPQTTRLHWSEQEPAIHLFTASCAPLDRKPRLNDDRYFRCPHCVEDVVANHVRHGLHLIVE